MQYGSLNIIKPGVLSLVQDRGRRGYMHQGMAQSGIMDVWSAFWANKLCANPVFSALLEISMGGLEAVATDATLIAVTGAKDIVFLNGKPMQTWQSFKIQAGDHLSIRYSKNQIRAYLAVRGGFQVQPHFGSYSTTMRDAIGGLKGNGAPLATNDKLAYFPSASGVSLRLAERWQDWHKEDIELHSSHHFRVLPTNQYYEFPKILRQRLLAETFTITPNISRMAYRLTGGDLQHRLPGMLSEATNLGDIQVPPDGQPIVLLNDRQTLGGYPKIGTLAAVDCWRFSQLKPSDPVQFQLSSVVRARNRRLELQQMMQELTLQPI